MYHMPARMPICTADCSADCSADCMCRLHVPIAGCRLHAKLESSTFPRLTQEAFESSTFPRLRMCAVRVCARVLRQSIKEWMGAQ